MDPVAYTPFFCEENIYHFARARLEQGATDGRVLLISNPREQVLLAGQRRGHGPSRLVVWDYHVVYVENGLVFDPDSALPLPTATDAYYGRTFPEGRNGSEHPYAARFAALSARRFLDAFSSDRSHMLGPDGGYIHPPPPWPAIHRPELGNTLFDLVHGAHPSVEYYGPSWSCVGE